MPTRKSGRCAALVLTVCAAVATQTPPASARGIDAGDFSVIGHRGYAHQVHTENTFPSFNDARRHGATAIEADMHLTADLVPVIMHDADLDRTTDCSGLVRDVTKDFIETRCAGAVHHEPIPTVRGLLSWGAAHRMNVIVEIKQDDHDLWDITALTHLDAMIKDAAMQDRVIVMSFSEFALRRAEEVDPALRTQWIADSWEEASTTGVQFDGVNVYARDLTAARVASLHTQGELVFARRTNKRKDWAHAIRVGADGVLTDRTPSYASWRPRFHR